MSPSTAGGGAAARTRALDRGLQILEVLADRSPLALGEIAAACELSPATATRILRTLELRGFVARDAESRVYRIGLKAFEVGSRFLSETRLQETCTLILRQLCASTGQSTTLAILHRADIVYLDAYEGSSPLRSTPQVGLRAPAHATASGKCLLAGRWADGLIEAIGEGPYPTMTTRTIASLDALREELAQVRRDGVAFDVEELHADISCMACPVQDRSGEVIAALGIQALSSQMASNRERWTQLLRSAASEASLRLGWRARPQEAQPRSTSQLTD